MSLLTGLIFWLENGTISFSGLIPSSWGSMGCMEVEQTLAPCRKRLVRLESPTEAAGPEVRGVLPSLAPLQRPDHDKTRGEAGEVSVGEQPCPLLQPRHLPGISPGEQEAKWLLGPRCWGRRGSVTY